MKKGQEAQIGLALGGGGARGSAHIGVLRVLKREEIPLSAVAGSSVGGFVGVLYASGRTPDEILEAMARMDKDLLNLDSERLAIFSLDSIRALLEEELGSLAFEDLQLPCAVVAVDLEHGEEVIIDRGSVVDGLLATIAVPGLFPPMRMWGRVLVDGGILNPVPVEVVRQLGPEHVIAVNIGSDRSLPHDEMGHDASLPFLGGRSLLELVPWREAIQIYSKANAITTLELAERRLVLEEPDVIIRPAVGEISLLDTEAFPAGVAAGESAALAKLPQIKALANPQRRRFSLFG